MAPTPERRGSACNATDARRAGVSGAACVVFATLVATLSFTPASGAAQTAVRVVAYNIRHGQGMDGRVDLERIAQVLRGLDADVITLQEVDDRTERTGGVDQAATLAEALGYRGFHGPHRPYQGGFYGNAILTRLPVLGETTHGIPPASGSALAVLEVIVESAPGRALSVVSVHLAGTPEERMAQADTVTARFAARTHPVILAGDFNGRPDDDVVGRLRRDWRTGAKRGDPLTYPADRPDREIDFVMWRSESERVGAALRLVGHFVVEEPLASDHRPLVADFRLETRRERP
jgi:endonuclease/exonuclease/phosphatase family metal-dependent hydrolase